MSGLRAGLTGGAAQRSDWVAEDIAKAVHPAGVAVHAFVLAHGDDLARCSSADFVDLVVRATVTYLFGHGLAVAAPDGAFDQWLSAELPEPYAEQVAERLREAVARRAASVRAGVAR